MCQLPIEPRENVTQKMREHSRVHVLNKICKLIEFPVRILETFKAGEAGEAGEARETERLMSL